MITSSFYFLLLTAAQHLTVKCNRMLGSVTRLGDLLDFGQLF